MAEAVKAEQRLPTKPDYGLDAPGIVRSMFSRAAWTLAIALAVFFVNRVQYPGPALRILAVLGVIALIFFAVGAIMVWSSRVAKLQLRDELLDSLALQPDAKVLDVGCGRGLMLIGAGKRLKSGKATGIDTWNPRDLSDNSADAAKQNAKIEGVADRVRIETCDPRKLPYPDNQYDAVVSSLAIHNIPDPAERGQAVREMYRVLKAGGHLLIFDLFYTGAYARVLREAGANDVQLSGLKFLWCLPSRSLTARK
jgi:arsenite methyltransferase